MSQIQDLFTDSQLYSSQNSLIIDDNNDEVEDQGFTQLSNNENNDENNDENISSNQRISQLNTCLTNDLNISGRKGESLVRTSLSEEAKRKYNDKYHETYLKIKEAENMSDICKSAQLLSEQMDKQNKYFKSGGVNENMPLDAKCILTNSAISLQLVKKLQTDSKQFDSNEFAEKLLTALNPSIDENESNLMIDSNDWIELGRKYCRFHKVVPTFHFIHGSFDSTLNEVQKQTKPRARVERPVLSAQTQATQLDPKSKANDESTPQEVESILRNVKRLEAINKSSLPYIPVIVNPQSMAQTVENIFHSAFLVKDGLARIDADEEDGNPVLQSIDNSQIDNANDDRGIQTIFSFTMNDWNYWIKKYDIKRPAIKHTK